jgi:RimJ/RimL family protein N-acetyltransferase
VPAFTIGYWIRPSAEGFGYVTEAVGLVVDFAPAALEAQRLEIACDPDNVRSMAIPQRLGFKMEGRARNVYRYADGRLCDEVIWSLTPTDARLPAAHK